MGAAATLSQLKRLWRLGFGDDAEWIDRFFDHYHTPEGCFTQLDAQSAVVAQMHALPLDCGGTYIYGVTTHPEWRGRGIATRMMECALAQLALRGEPYAMLIAAGPHLWPWYGQLGFAVGADAQVEVTGYDGECLSNDDPALNRPLWRVLNVGSYLALCGARHQLPAGPLVVTDPIIAANCGTYVPATGTFMPGERLDGAQEITVAQLMAAYPLDFSAHLAVPDPRSTAPIIR